MSDFERRPPGKGNTMHDVPRPSGTPGRGSLSAKVYRYASGTPPQSPARDALEEASRSSGEPLPEPLRDDLAGALGADLGDVRLHTGAASAKAAETLDAHAFTAGSDIHFGSGAHDLASDHGRRLVAHEVAHTVQQQGGGGVQAKSEITTPDDACETEADVFAEAFMRLVPAWENAKPSSTAAIERRELPPVSRGAAPGRIARDAKAEAPEQQAAAMMVVIAYKGDTEVARWIGPIREWYWELPMVWNGTRAGGSWEWDDAQAASVTIESPDGYQPNVPVGKWAVKQGANRIRIAVHEHAGASLSGDKGYGVAGESTGGTSAERRDARTETGQGSGGQDEEERAGSEEGFDDGTGGRGEEGDGVGEGSGDGDDTGTGSKDGRSGGFEGGSEDPSWAEGGRISDERGGRIGDAVHGREHGRHGGTPGAEGHVDGMGWFKLIDAPEEIAPLVNLGMLLADANYAGFGRKFLSKTVRGLSQRVLRRELKDFGKVVIQKNLARVRKQLNKSPKYRSLSKAEKKKILKRTELALEREYYKRAAEHFKKKADEHAAIAKKYADEADDVKEHIGTISRENRDAYREMERAARAEAKEAQAAADQARKMEGHAEKKAGSAEKKFNKDRDKARARGGVQGTGGLNWKSKSVVELDGFEVRGVRDLSHMEDDALRDMAKTGTVGVDHKGRPLDVHHHGQSPEGPFVEIPRQKHSIHNRKQHPHGNAPGEGLSDDERAAFNAWRKRYWKARARDELSKRGIET